MKTMLIPILTVAATCTAFAELERKDSSEFDYKYEMIKLPTAEDVDGSGKYDFTGSGTLGTGENSGTIFMSIAANTSLKADAAAVGNNGDVWRKMDAGVGADKSGYTVEVRLKVTNSTGNFGALLLSTSTGDSDINSWLVFDDNALYWGNSQNNKIMDIDTTQWHNYRIVREKGSKVHSVFVDGELVSASLGDGLATKQNRIFLGSANANYTGEAQIAYIRFTDSAYAPLDPKSKENWLNSSEFDVKYEMNDTDKVPTSTSTSDWTINGASGATISKSDGVLSVNPNGKNTFWTTTDAAWKNTVTAGTPYTIEFSAKINSCALTGDNDRSLLFWAGSTKAVGVLMVGVNHVYWQTTSSMGDNILLDTSDNTDKMHKFRIAYDGSSRHGFSVWRDDVMIGHILVDTTAYYKTDGSYNFVRFGKPGGNNSGSYDIDYVRWKIGGVYPPDTRKGLMVIVK